MTRLTTTLPSSRRRRTATVSPRPRVEFSDAAAVRERVEGSAAELRLRGARRHALTAVLKLLCGYSRLTDDRVGLSQIVDLIAAAGWRRYDVKTVGRALASLAADELILYRPAQGRGKHALVAIHTRFTEGIEVLQRDRSGRVIVDYSSRSKTDSVTFSEPLPYIDQKNYLPTLRNDRRRETSRPIGVRVPRGELKTVMDGLPEPMAQLPRHLRWKLGSEILQRLKRGWRADQILEVLNAEMPAQVQRPYKLAIWRLQQNVVGAGPRLRPLQAAWDARAAAAARAEAEDTKDRRFAALAAMTSPELRAQVLLADEAKFGRRSQDPMAALGVAARLVTFMFPEMPLAEALARWASDVLAGYEPQPVAAEPVSAVPSLSEELQMDLAITGGCNCVVCGSDHGTYRPELPLKAMATVCDQCWPDIAADLAGGGDEDEFEEAISA
ncbi:hypothetical protein Mycsm_07083 (plasmid) [Mycobacterium sp. JS623]|uniref:hypothetical protein n=1 Tax=Mycobacterium sp. JS623 TaxID=212767 RepID=UPI0002A558D4|nr:hypothetical protein [Mycobacterium sp. JS623]AGB27180.1 hypothetical protein Mycsm_07083 [Mycobacterium sp. JS623]